MKNNIRYLLQLTFLILLIPSVIYSQNNSIGKLVKKTGYVKKTNINCDSDECAGDNLLIYPGDRIETGSKSSASILLNDGTAVELLEKSDLIILSIINKRDKTLTSFFSDYGKFKIIQENDFFDASLVIKTRTAIIKSVSASISIITGYEETGIFVYKGEAGFANIDPTIIEAYVIQSGYESFLKKSTPPLSPVKVQKTLRTSWIKRHFLTKDNERILRYNKTNGAADWFFIEKK
ncbi:MAG: hypothetical protein CVV49_03960 [Spirochaetae bacterium HGW-Spirochaetae-5]|nr:MAG: hypothetical protein CVV49_03960 [Spirochaetae bacterium HGW-Spirochaetae-5]